MPTSNPVWAALNPKGRPITRLTSDLHTGDGVLNRHNRLFSEAYHAWNYTTDPDKWGNLAPGNHPIQGGGQLEVVRDGTTTRYTVVRGDYRMEITRDSARPGWLRLEHNGESLETRGDPAAGQPPEGGGPGMEIRHTVGGQTYTFDISAGMPRITYPDGTVRIVNRRNELATP